jgi:hypothetical protein
MAQGCDTEFGEVRSQPEMEFGNKRKARDLPPQLRNELMQSADKGYPPGYEGLLKTYCKDLSTAEK